MLDSSGTDRGTDRGTDKGTDKGMDINSRHFVDGSFSKIDADTTIIEIVEYSSIFRAERTCLITIFGTCS